MGVQQRNVGLGIVKNARIPQTQVAKNAILGSNSKETGPKTYVIEFALSKIALNVPKTHQFAKLVKRGTNSLSRILKSEDQNRKILAQNQTKTQQGTKRHVSLRKSRYPNKNAM